MPKLLSKKNYCKLIAVGSAVGLANYFLGCMKDNVAPPLTAVPSVYVAGSGIGNSIAAYFKNGMPASLTDGSLRASATAIAVAGNDVYVAGYEGGVAKYWKNGVAVTLEGANDGGATSIAVSGNDAYVAGTEFSDNKYVAKYWKNGIAVNLTDGSSFGYVTSIFGAK